jgi:hypothetical protein
MFTYWQTLALAAIACFPFLLAVSTGQRISSATDVLHLVSNSISALTIALAAFNWGLWRILPRALAPKPNLNGTWLVTLTPTDPEGRSLPCIRGFMRVKQSYTSLSMRLFTADTHSELISETIGVLKSGTFQLSAIYECEPYVTGRIPLHRGAMVLIEEDAGSTRAFNGHFWIDGDLHDREHNRLNDGGKTWCRRGTPQGYSGAPSGGRCTHEWEGVTFRRPVPAVAIASDWFCCHRAACRRSLCLTPSFCQPPQRRPPASDRSPGACRK